MDDFEQRLKRQSLRQIPAEWRAEVLAAARAEQPVRQLSSAVREHRSMAVPPGWQMALTKIFWPHPKAWAGLAAVWIFIFVLNFSMRDQTTVIAENSLPPSPETMAELKQQRLMFAQLMGANDLQPADRQKLLPLPRSERRIEIMTA